MILDFDFTLASREGSGEPVHLHSLARVFDVRMYTQNMAADEDSDLNWPIQTITIKIVGEPLR